jgi:hypothetical protein
MDPGSILAYLKLPTKVLAGIALAALCVLFLPESLIAATGLLAARTDYRWALGLAIWISAALIIVEGVAALWTWQMQRTERERAKLEKAEAASREASEKLRLEAEEEARKAAQQAAKLAAGIKFIEGMTDPERHQCAKFINSRERTVWLDAEDGVVGELVRRGVLYAATGVTHFDMNFHSMGADFTMADWAREHLQAHPELVVVQKPRKSRANPRDL